MPQADVGKDNSTSFTRGSEHGLHSTVPSKLKETVWIQDHNYVHMHYYKKQISNLQ